MGILVGCAQRWRSFIIQDDVYSSAFSVLLKIMERNDFPSLTHISVERVPSYLKGRFCRFYSRRCPRLQFLDLGRDLISSFSPSSDFPIPPSLTSLALRFRTGDPSSILPHVLLQKLTTLALSGVYRGLELHPNSVHLPLLKWFICKVSGAKMLIRAIAARRPLHISPTRPGGGL